MHTADDKILLRLFAEVPDTAAAAVTARSVQRKVAAHGRVCRAYTKQYWKIEGYFEVCFDLDTGERTAAAFEGLLTALGTGWEVHRFPDGVNWAVWNPSATAVFMLPEVRWANLECYAEGRDASAAADHDRGRPCQCVRECVWSERCKSSSGRRSPARN